MSDSTRARTAITGEVEGVVMHGWAVVVGTGDCKGRINTCDYPGVHCCDTRPARVSQGTRADGGLNWGRACRELIEAHAGRITLPPGKAEVFIISDGRDGRPLSPCAGLAYCDRCGLHSTFWIALPQNGITSMSCNGWHMWTGTDVGNDSGWRSGGG